MRRESLPARILVLSVVAHAVALIGLAIAPVALGGDLDSDGVPDESDICPRSYDPAQEDADGDGVGDACDTCPAHPNAEQRPVRLNGPLIPGGYVQDYKFTPDGSTVVYTATQQSFEADLYAVPVGGGVPVQLASVYPGSTGIERFEISPDGAQVVFMGRLWGAEYTHLYSAPLDGSGAAQINAAAPGGQDATDFAISPDGPYVVYRGNSFNPSYYELFSVPIAGGVIRRLNEPPGAYLDITEFVISPDATRVVFEDTGKLFSVLMDGSGRVQLDDELHNLKSWELDEIAISADSTAVAYRAETPSANYDVYTVSITGGTPLQLNRPLVEDGRVTRHAIGPDGATVVYLADRYLLWVNELFSVPIEGGSEQYLNIPVGDGDVLSDFQISSDGARVYYRVGGGDAKGFYGVPVNGGESTAIILGNFGPEWELSPDGGSVAYRRSWPAYDLYGVSALGGDPTLLQQDVVDPETGPGHAIRADSDLVVFRYGSRIFSIPIGGGRRFRLDEPGVSGNVQSFLLSPTGDHAAFIGRDAGIEQLYSVPLEQDVDGDAIAAACDNCPLVSNLDQADTDGSDDLVESITEELSASGPPGERFSHLEQRWTVDVPAGSRIELHVEGFRSTSADGDDFVFEYSTNGGVSWDAIALPSLPFVDDDVDRSGSLPSSLAGTIWIRVVDTDRAPGNQDLDTVSIDELVVRSVL